MHFYLFFDRSGGFCLFCIIFPLVWCSMLIFDAFSDTLGGFAGFKHFLIGAPLWAF